MSSSGLTHTPIINSPSDSSAYERLTQLFQQTHNGLSRGTATHSQHTWHHELHTRLTQPQTQTQPHNLQFPRLTPTHSLVDSPRERGYNTFATLHNGTILIHKQYPNTLCRQHKIYQSIFSSSSLSFRTCVRLSWGLQKKKYINYKKKIHSLYTKERWTYIVPVAI